MPIDDVSLYKIDHLYRRMKCQAQMLLARIAPAHLDIDLYTFECAVCDHVLKTVTAYEDPMKSRALGRWLQGDLRSPK